MVDKNSTPIPDILEKAYDEDTKTWRVGIVGASPLVTTTILSGSKVVALAGTPEALAGSTANKSVVIKAKITNTDVIIVGNSTSQNYPLQPGETVSFGIDNLNKVYIDSIVNGEGVDYVGEN